MDDVVIRRLEPSELDRLQPLWKAMADHHRDLGRAPLPYRSADESWRRRRARYATWIREPDAAVFVAEADGRIAGYAVSRVGGEQATVTTGRVGELESLAVLPDRRGGGIGTALLDAVLDHFRSLGVREWSLAVMEGNDRARALYERMGMRPYVQVMLGRVPDG